MKDKKIITKENYKQIMLKRGIIACWVLLGVCLAIKLLGGDFFAIASDNETFISFCNFCDTSIIKYVIYYVCFVFTFINHAVMTSPENTIKSKRFIIYVIIVTCVWTVKLLFELLGFDNNLLVYNIVSVVLSYIALVVYSKKYWQPLVVIAYDFVLSFISAFIKNVGLGTLLTNSFLMTTIFAIDYYIMLTLSSLYRKKNYKKEG